jgi:hypothetical protein
MKHWSKDEGCGVKVSEEEVQTVEGLVDEGDTRFVGRHQGAFDAGNPHDTEVQ